MHKCISENAIPGAIVSLGIYPRDRFACFAIRARERNKRIKEATESRRWGGGGL